MADKAKVAAKATKAIKKLGRERLPQAIATVAIDMKRAGHQLPNLNGELQ